VASADLVIGAVLIPGAAAPKLVSRAQLKLMRPGSVLVDVAIDQGGCFETSKATTHQNPTYEVDGIVHYCVANMPGGVARTSTFALTNATLPFAVQLANKGARQAMLDDEHLRDGIYELRARAWDGAGNERSTDRRASGADAKVTLPLRVKTQLRVGKRVKVRARSSRGRRAARTPTRRPSPGLRCR
jgi:hypothetical protein